MKQGLDVGRQNDAYFLDRLCAEEYFKRRARLIQMYRLLTALLAAGLGISFSGIQEASATIASIGLAIAITNAFADRLERNQIRMAASIKDIFDSALLGLSVSTLNSYAPSEEEILHSARKMSRRRSTLMNWYPDASGIPLGYGKLLCQRASVIWDLRLRRRVGLTAITLASGATLLLVLVGVFQQLTLLAFLANWLAPAGALIIFLAQLGVRHLEAGRERAAMLSIIERVWQDSVQKGVDIGEREITTIQDAILRVRASGPVVPKVFHRWSDDSFRKEMGEAVERLKLKVPAVDDLGRP